MLFFQPSETEREEATPHERAMLDDAENFEKRLSGYMKLQSTHPQSVAYSLADSPAGLAAWLYALFQDVSSSDGNPERVFTQDEMLDDFMLYWLPNAGPSSARIYWKAMGPGAAIVPPSQAMPTPAGISMFPGEQVRISRRWAERRLANLVHFNELDRGSHFAALEQPALFVDEVRTTFRSLR